MIKMPAKTTGRLVKVPATTNNITRGVINFLTVRGHYAFRVNTTGIWDPTKQILRRSTTPAGASDVVACLKLPAPYMVKTAEGHKYLTAGLFLAVEIKNKFTRDKMRPDQEVFAANVRAAGGIYLVVKRYEDFIAWYNEFFTQFTPKEGARIL